MKNKRGQKINRIIFDKVPTYLLRGLLRNLRKA